MRNPFELSITPVTPLMDELANDLMNAMRNQVAFDGRRLGLDADIYVTETQFTPLESHREFRVSGYFVGQGKKQHPLMKKQAHVIRMGDHVKFVFVGPIELAERKRDELAEAHFQTCKWTYEGGGAWVFTGTTPYEKYRNHVLWNIHSSDVEIA